MNTTLSAPNYTQKHRPIAVATPLGEDVFLLRRMTGREQLGRLFELRLELLSEHHQIPAQEILGQNVTVRMPLPSGEMRYFNGFASEYAQLDDAGRLTCHEVILRPWLWFLSQTSDCRIFQNKTVPEILREVFAAHGSADVRDALFNDYAAREYCVQYRETDFNFVSRLMEEAGIYYYFAHHDGRHELVLCDDFSSHDRMPGYQSVPYFPYDDGAGRERDHLFRWQVSHSVQPTSYALNDFDFERPRAHLAVSSSAGNGSVTPPLEVYDYPGGYLERDRGEERARLHLEGLHVQRRHVRAQGNARGLSVGVLFDLSDFPREDQNQEYLIVSASYDVHSDACQAGASVTPEETFHVGLTAIQSKHPFRSPRITAKPVMPGPQTATVVGKNGAEIWTDEHGRVKVQFRWDRYGRADESSSCWIRVSQGAAGKGWGTINLPRIGQEVIVDFIEGDPDRPVVTGRLFNGACPPPYGLPDNATISTTKTSSSSGGSGFNEIRFQDKKGEEQIFVHAEKNKDVRVKNDVYAWIGQDRHEIVRRDVLEEIANERHVTIGADSCGEIGKDLHLKVKGKQALSVGGSRSVTVNGNVSERFCGHHSERLSGDFYLKGKALVFESLEGITLQCGASSIVLDATGVTITGPMVTVDGQMVKIASGPGALPKKGTTVRSVRPAKPRKPYEADAADPGTVAGIKADEAGKGKGKYGDTPIRPFVPTTVPPGGEDGAKTWIEIELVDDDGEPIAGERYQVTLPDGQTVASGTLDENGFARIDGLDPGECRIVYPDIETLLKGDDD